MDEKTHSGESCSTGEPGGGAIDPPSPSGTLPPAPSASPPAAAPSPPQSEIRNPKSEIPPGGWGLRPRILLPLVLLLFVAFSVVGAAAVSAVRQRVDQEMQARLEGARSVLTWVRFKHFKPDPETLERMRQGLAGIEVAALDGEGKLLTTSGGAPLTSLKGPAAADLGRRAAESNLFQQKDPLPEAVLAGGSYRLVLAGNYPPTDPGVPRGFLLLISNAEVHKAQWEAIRPLLFLLVLTLIAVVLVGIQVTQYVTHPLRRLAAEARAIAGGRLDHPLTTGAAGEVGELAQAFATMVESLRRSQEALVRSEKLSAIGQIAAGIAHEIRNPLGALRMTAEVVRRERPEGDPAREDLDRMLAEIRRLENIVNDLLAFARPASPRLRAVGLGPLVSEVLETVRPQFAHRGIEARTDLPEDLPKVQADPDQVKQILWNLLLNAAEATERGGAIKIAARLEGGRILLRVSDTGGGIPPEVGPRIFEPFFTTKPGGTGLGLPLCKLIAEAHGGSIRFVSEKGAGTTFEVALPLKPP